MCQLVKPKPDTAKRMLYLIDRIDSAIYLENKPGYQHPSLRRWMGELKGIIYALRKAELTQLLTTQAEGNERDKAG